MNTAIIGYSGHAYVVLEAALTTGVAIAYYCERSKLISNPFDLTYLGDERSFDFDWDKFEMVILGIGDNLIRKDIAEYVNSKGKTILTIIHPAATLSKTASVDSGTFIAPGVIVNAFATVGKNCILNTSCIVEHECKIQNNVHIAPGAVLAGNVSVGEGTFIGANAVIKQGITIGSNVTVGAGAVVIKNIPDNQTWIGNPAKVHKK